MRSDSTSAVVTINKAREGVWKVKVPHPKSTFRIATSRKRSHNALFLEISGNRKFSIGDDSDTGHFAFKCLQEPRVFAQKKIVNLPKSVSLPRPLDEELIRECHPFLELMDRGEHYVLAMTINLSGPYPSDDQESYFHNNEFAELWDIEESDAEELLTNWEHYESRTPRIFRHGEIMEKQHDFVVPLVPYRKLKQENVNLYHQMIRGGDRPRILLLGMFQRPVPRPVQSGNMKILHSFFAGFALDGHHKLAAYRRAGVPANCLVVVSSKASKYKLLEGEEGAPRARIEDRLSALAATAAVQ